MNNFIFPIESWNDQVVATMGDLNQQPLAIRTARRLAVSANTSWRQQWTATASLAVLSLKAQQLRQQRRPMQTQGTRLLLLRRQQQRPRR